MDTPQTHRKPFQFRLGTMMVAVTGVGVIASLVSWDLNLGTFLAIAIVGTAWSAAARRAGYRRLAYYLASFTLGTAACMPLASPLSPMTRAILDLSFLGPEFGIALLGMPYGPWMHILLMCIASLATAFLLRRPIRTCSRAWIWLIALGAAYLGCASFGVLFVVSGAIGSMEFGMICSVAPIVVVATLMVCIFSLHVAWPMSIAFCVVLRAIDPGEPEETVQESSEEEEAQPVEDKEAAEVDPPQTEPSPPASHAADDSVGLSGGPLGERLDFQGDQSLD